MIDLTTSNYDKKCIDNFFDDQEIKDDIEEIND
jgi:hypothetical protein